MVTASLSALKIGAGGGEALYTTENTQFDKGWRLDWRGSSFFCVCMCPGLDNFLQKLSG